MIQLFIHSLTHAFIHSFIHSFTHPLAHSLTPSLIYSFTHSFIHSSTHSFILFSLIHSLDEYLFTQSLFIHCSSFTHSCIQPFNPSIHPSIHLFIHSFRPTCSIQMHCFKWSNEGVAQSKSLSNNSVHILWRTNSILPRSSKFTNWFSWFLKVNMPRSPQETINTFHSLKMLS